MPRVYLIYVLSKNINNTYHPALLSLHSLYQGYAGEVEQESILVWLDAQHIFLPVKNTDHVHCIDWANNISMDARSKVKRYKNRDIGNIGHKTIEEHIK